MAKSDYRRRACVVEECAGEHKANGYCLRHYRQSQRGTVHKDVAQCVHCGQQFRPTKAGNIYCARKCKVAAWKAANQAALARSRQAKTSAIYAGYCEGCAQAFVARRKRKYCGPACEPAHKHYLLGTTYTPPIRTCRNCGLQWSAIRRVGAAAYCDSPECQQARRKEASYSSGGSNTQRAKRAGVPYRYFDERKVLARDGWTCQLCGIQTPPEARGTTRPDAPEFDHCLAMALGGPHLPANGQCLCRTCNGLKSDRWCALSIARAVARGLQLKSG